MQGPTLHDRNAAKLRSSLGGRAMIFLLSLKLIGGGYNDARRHIILHAYLFLRINE